MNARFGTLLEAREKNRQALADAMVAQSVAEKQRASLARWLGIGAIFWAAFYGQERLPQIRQQAAKIVSSFKRQRSQENILVSMPKQMQSLPAEQEIFNSSEKYINEKYRITAPSLDWPSRIQGAKPSPGYRTGNALTFHEPKKARHILPSYRPARPAEVAKTSGQPMRPRAKPMASMYRPVGSDVPERLIANTKEYPDVKIRPSTLGQ